MPVIWHSSAIASKRQKNLELVRILVMTQDIHNLCAALCTLAPADTGNCMRKSFVFIAAMGNILW